MEKQKYIYQLIQLPTGLNPRWDGSDRITLTLYGEPVEIHLTFLKKKNQR